MSIQRSLEWHEERRGKFTSSCISDLMGEKALGKTGDSLAFKKACEIVMGLDPDDDYIDYNMQRGIDLEPDAYANFREKAEMDFLDLALCGFIQLNENEGGSPDGIVNKKNPLEIKCPKRNKFLKLVLDGIVDPDHYLQVQHQIKVMGADKGYFHNFIVHKGKPYGHTIEIGRDQKVIDKMDIRIKEAVIIRDKYVEQLKSKLKLL